MFLLVVFIFFRIDIINRAQHVCITLQCDVIVLSTALIVCFLRHRLAGHFRACLIALYVAVSLRCWMTCSIGSLSGLSVRRMLR